MKKIIAKIFLLMLLAACNSDDKKTERVYILVDQEGGAFNGPQGLQLVIPPMAVNESVDVTLSAQDLVIPGADRSSSVFELKPTDLALAQPSDLVIPYLEVPNLNPQDLIIFKSDTINAKIEEWTPLETQVSTDTKEASTKINQFGYFFVGTISKRTDTSTGTANNINSLCTASCNQEYECENEYFFEYYSSLQECIQECLEEAEHFLAELKLLVSDACYNAFMNLINCEVNLSCDELYGYDDYDYDDYYEHYLDDYYDEYYPCYDEEEAFFIICSEEELELIDWYGYEESTTRDDNVVDNMWEEIELPQPY